jgi:hypothetical protein
LKNFPLKPRTIADIDSQVDKVLGGLGVPEPPIDLTHVRELLKLDRGFYSTTDTGVLRETISRLKVAGLQVLKRPTLLIDAVRTLSLKALYLPDRKRILLETTPLGVLEFRAMRMSRRRPTPRRASGHCRLSEVYIRLGSAACD